MREIKKKTDRTRRDGLYARPFDFRINTKGVIQFEQGTLLESIPPGIYMPGIRGGYYLQTIETEQNENELEHYFPIENYNSGLKEADKNINRFIEAKDYYRRNNLPYKRSVLIYGDSGTGKSQYIHHISKKLVKERNAIVIRVQNDAMFYSLKNRILPLLNALTDRLKVIIIEELCEIKRMTGESEISRLLSNPNTDNILFLMTTNHPEEISAFLVNDPSKIDVLAEVYSDQFKADFIDAWYQFIIGKPITTKQKRKPWYNEVSNNLSPAYLKELFAGSLLHRISIQSYWEEIKSRKDEIHRKFSNKTRIRFNDDEYFDDELSLKDLEELERVLEMNTY